MMEYSRTPVRNLEWCHRMMGDRDAQFNLAINYEFGCGVNKNVDEAIKLYTLSANNGHSIAHFVLASLYEHGKGIEINLNIAAELYNKAMGLLMNEVNNGDLDAYCYLAYCYENGYGVTKNLTKAAELYNYGVEHGYADFINRLKNRNNY